MTDIPQVFSIHAFVCSQQRPPGHPRGSCAEAGSRPLLERLTARIDGLKRPDIAVTATGCLGFCRAGPVMVVYPQGVWYVPRTVEDVDAIVDRHVLKGELVEDLIIVPQV